MAHAIITGARRGDAGTALSVGIIYAIPVADRVANAVHTASSDLAEPVASIATVAEKDALDAGEAVYFTRSMVIPLGMSLADARTNVERKAPDWAAKVIGDYKKKYLLYGKDFTFTEA